MSDGQGDHRDLVSGLLRVFENVLKFFGTLGCDFCCADGAEPDRSAGFESGKSGAAAAGRIDNTDSDAGYITCGVAASTGAEVVGETS